MKKNINLFSFLILISAFTLSCCDKIEGPYTTINNNGNTKDTVRKVLLEEFTGQQCVYCPGAHKISEELIKLYGSQIIVVAGHVGGYAVPSTSDPLFMTDYRSEAGNDISTQFNISGLPIGMINRKLQGVGNYLVSSGNFATEVSKYLDSLPKTPDVYIYLEPTINSSDSTLSVKTDVTFLKDFSQGLYKLCVVITESGMTGAQKNNNSVIGTTPIIFNYVHKHVLRGSLNTSFGEVIKNGVPMKNEKISKSLTGYKLGTTWKPENCKVVAYLYYADGPKNWEIIQAQEVKIK